MRHRKSGAKLNRTSSHRKAMFRNMVTSLFKHDRIRTTDTKAKELRGWADHIITLAKRGDLHARRQAMSIIREKDVVHKLFAEVSDRFGKVSGGYTRVIKLGRRPGDAAPVSLIELITPESREKKKPAKKAKPAPAKKAETKTEEKKPAEVTEEQTETEAAEAVEDTDDNQGDAAVETSEPKVAQTEAEPEEDKASEAAAPAAEPEVTEDAAETQEDKPDPKEKE